MKCALHYGRVRRLSGCDHHRRDAIDIGEQRRVTARKLAHEVLAECLQFVQVSLTLEESHLRTRRLAVACNRSPDLSANSCRRFCAVRERFAAMARKARPPLQP